MAYSYAGQVGGAFGSKNQFANNPFAPGGANYDPSGGYHAAKPAMNWNATPDYKYTFDEAGNPTSMYKDPAPVQRQTFAPKRYGANAIGAFQKFGSREAAEQYLADRGSRATNNPTPTTPTTPAAPATDPGVGTGTLPSYEDIFGIANSMRAAGGRAIDPNKFAVPGITEAAKGELDTLYQDVQRMNAYQNATDFEREASGQLQSLLAGEAQGGLDKAGLLAQLNADNLGRDSFQTNLMMDLLNRLLSQMPNLFDV